MAIQVTPVARALGAIVSGVDLSQDLEQSVIDRLGERVIEHRILFFRQQPISPEAQARFAARFGSLHVHPIYPVLPELPQIMLIDTHEGFLPDNRVTQHYAIADYLPERRTMHRATVNG